MEQARRGDGQVVALVGEPGVGKSRLVHEVTTPSPGGVAGPRGAPTPSARRGVPADDLAAAGLLRPPGVGRRARHPRKSNGGAAGPRPVAPGDPPGPPHAARCSGRRPRLGRLDPRQRRQRTLDAIRRLLLSESQRQPLCVVLEDLHWIDPETQAVLDALIDSLPAARVLLLLTYRPEYKQDWSRKSYCPRSPSTRCRTGWPRSSCVASWATEWIWRNSAQQLIERTEESLFSGGERPSPGRDRRCPASAAPTVRAARQTCRGPGNRAGSARSAHRPAPVRR